MVVGNQLGLVLPFRYCLYHPRPSVSAWADWQSIEIAAVVVPAAVVAGSDCKTALEIASWGRFDPSSDPDSSAIKEEKSG